MAKVYGAPKKKIKTSKKTPQAEPQARLFPIKAVALLCFLLIGFGAFLYQINGAWRSTPAPKVQPKEPISAGSKLPEPPQEKWQYINNLAKQNVNIDVEPSQQRAVKKYKIQCGSFRRRQDAESMQAQIAFAGLSASIQTTQSKSLWNRVVLGPYLGKRAAEVARHKIQRLGIETCQIWYWN
jgi:cell division protein FtsN